MLKRIMMLSVLMIFPIGAETKEVRIVEDISVPIVEPKANLYVYERKLLERTKAGMYLVQDFYGSGEKLTDPYIMNNTLKLVILNLENKDLSAIHVEDNFDFYRFLNAYDTFAQIEGKLITWYKSGVKRSEEYYQQGLPLGKQTFWYENGIKAKEIDYIDFEEYKKSNRGVRAMEECCVYTTEGWKLTHGYILHYKAWYINGQLWEDSDFSNRKRFIIKKWYDNGQPQVARYTDNSSRLFKDVELTVWDEKGKKILFPELSPIYNYHINSYGVWKTLKETPDGFLVQSFFLNGNKASEPFLSKRKLETKPDPYMINFNYYSLYDCLAGKVIRYDIGSNKIEEQICTKGNPISQITYWYSNGQIKAQGIHKNSFRKGVWKEWYENGQFKAKIDYDQQDGLYFIYYYPNGQLKQVHNIGSKASVTYGTNPDFYTIDQSVDKNKSKKTYWHGDTKLMEYVFTYGFHDDTYGELTEWYNNGQIAGQGSFGDYFKGRDWSYWNKQGNKLEIIE